jgi:uncharacterized phage protein (TIGR02218 family)
MIPATPELDALLATGRFVFANCFEIVLKDGLGTVVRLTEHDQDLALQSDTFCHAIVTGARLRRVRGLEVDEQTIVWTPPADYTVRGKPVRELVRLGLFDLAAVSQRRAFAPDWASPVTGWIDIFAGIVTQAEHLGGAITLSISSLLVLLNTSVPPAVYQAACRHVFGAPACGVEVAALSVADTASAGSTRATILCGLGQAAHAWDHGRVTMLSGANLGVARAVKTSAPGRLDLYGPFPYPVAPGDAFRVWPGCNKTLDQCRAFGNEARFGGQPWVPVPETGT